MNKQVAYGYDDALLTHQPRVVYDTIASESYNLYWDLNGNLQEISNCKSEDVRFHSWDEENRLRAVVGPTSAGLYGYDGNGDRVWKLIGDCDIESQNGGNIEYSIALDDAVLYPNPYLTITPQGYTKHYYLGSERIATALGEGGLKSTPEYWNQREEDLVQDFGNHFKGYEPFGTVEDYKTTNVDVADNGPYELQYGCPPFQLSYLQLIGSDMFSSCMNTYSNSTGRPESTFFTHSDHLGSASWITDGLGNPVQYIHYAPYGEFLANQRATGSTYDERYKFTGKERDAETGYDYYGARYQIVPLGIWGSPDPLLDKYIHLSPYMYCNGNPIKYVDIKGTHPAALALLVACPEIVLAATALTMGVVLYNCLTHQEELNKTLDWEGNKQLSETSDTRVGLVWQNRQDRKAKRAAELQELEHQQFLQDNLPDPSPDPNKGKDPKGDINRVKKGTVIALAVGYAAAIIDNFKENTTPKVEIKDETTQDNENATIEPLKE